MNCIPLTLIICELLCKLLYELLVTYCETLSDPNWPFIHAWGRATRELGPTNGNCPQRVNYWPIWFAHKGQLSIKPPPHIHTIPYLARARWLPPSPPTYPHKMDQLTDTTRETFTVDRRGRPALSLKLSVTGFSSLADAKQLCLQSTGAAWPGSYCGGP